WLPAVSVYRLTAPPLAIDVEASSVAEVDATPLRSVAPKVTVGLLPRSYEPALVGAAIVYEIAGGVRSSLTVWVTTVLLPALSVTFAEAAWARSIAGRGTVAGGA